MKPPPSLPTDSTTMMEIDTPMCDVPLQWTNFLPELRREILHYLDETDFGELSMVSRQCREDCSSFSQRRRAVIRCLPNNAGDFHYLHPLAAALLKVPTPSNSHQKAYPVFQERFTYFQMKHPSHLPKIMNREAKPIIKALTMSHVTQLDMSSSSASSSGKNLPHVAPSVAKLMTQIVPNVQVLDLSHNQVGTATLADASRHCKKLETIQLRGGTLASSITGVDLKQCESLKELYLDHTLVAASAREEKDVFEDADQEEVCPFQYCLRNLEKVSLKGCRYFNMTTKNSDKPFTQQGLIKFVRNAHNLKWLDSDLTAENVKMLKYERPNVVFVGHE